MGMGKIQGKWEIYLGNGRDKGNDNGKDTMGMIMGKRQGEWE